MIMFFVVFLPIAISVLLFWLNLQINTNEFLSLTLQVVWGIMVSLGGGVIYLTKFKFNENKSTHKFRKIVTDQVKWLCFPLIIQTLLFVLIAIIYPLRKFLSAQLNLSPGQYEKISTIADSLLVGLISTPSIFSILVGLWCIYLAIYHGEDT